MATNNVLSWQHERAAVVTKARALVETAGKEGRELTADENKLVDGYMEQAEALEGKIQREQRLQGMEGGLEKSQRAAVKPENAEEAKIGMTINEMEQYSLIRAIRAMATGDWRQAGLEKEASEATAKRMGIVPQGLLVPYDWVAKPGREQRDLTKGTNSAGGYTVATDLLAQNFIEMLRNRMVLQKAGITVLDGLMGDIAIPRQTGGATAYWVAESGAPTESQQVFDQVAMSPKTMGAYTDYSRKLIKQSSLSIERFVRADLSRVVGLEGDRAGLHGSGSSNQPTGVAATSGIGSVAGGTNGLAPAWSHIVGLETEVAVDNADEGTISYITNAKVRGKLKQVERTANSGVFLWQDGATLNGYKAWVSNQVSSTLTKGSSSGVCSAIFYGNWNDLFMGMWGGLDLLVDPYTGGTSGTVRVIVLQDIDFAVRHPESFALMADALTT